MSCVLRISTSPFSKFRNHPVCLFVVAYFSIVARVQSVELFGLIGSIVEILNLPVISIVFRIRVRSFTHIFAPFRPISILYQSWLNVLHEMSIGHIQYSYTTCMHAVYTWLCITHKIISVYRSCMLTHSIAHSRYRSVIRSAFFASCLLHCLSGNILVSGICKRLKRVCAYQYSCNGSSNESNTILSTFCVGTKWDTHFECLKAAFLPYTTGKPTSLKEASSVCMCAGKKVLKNTIVTVVVTTHQQQQM